MLPGFKKKPPEDNRRQLIVSVAILVMMLAVGASGFYLLGDHFSAFESIYVTALILTTVGMKESTVHLNFWQQLWALMVMLGGICAALYAAGNVVAFIIDGEMHRLFGRQQLQNKIERLNGHYVVCGFGRMGHALCESLAQSGAHFIVIDSNPECIKQAEASGYLHVQGDASSEEVLRMARVESARGLACCLPTDAGNVFVTLTARGINAYLSIVSKADELESDPKLRRAGADHVICP
jgi:voltage-gated potassium channel